MINSWSIEKIIGVRVRLRFIAAFLFFLTGVLRAFQGADLEVVGLYVVVGASFGSEALDLLSAKRLVSSDD